MATMAHRLRREVALMHTLGAVLARRSAIFINTFGLALAAAHACAAGAKSSRSHDRRHVVGKVQTRKT